MAPPKKELDMSSLQSYSPSWSSELRFSTAIAVQYAVGRCLTRVREVGTAVSSQAKHASTEHIAEDEDEEEEDDAEKSSGPTGAARRMWRQNKRKEYMDDWHDFAQKFLTASCQHLGIAPEVLPPGQITLNDVLNAAQGRPIDPDAEPVQAPDFEMGTSEAPKSHEGTGSNEKALRQLEEEHQRAAEKRAEAGETEIEKGMEQLKVDEKQADASAAQESKPPARQGGALDTEEGRGREIEVVNELLLVALGLGQYRAEDGASTLFEQEAIFADMDAGVATKPSTHAAPADDDDATGNKSGRITPSDLEQKADAPAPPAEQNKAGLGNEVADNIAAAGEKAWGAIRMGATSSWKGLTAIGNSATSSPPQQKAPHPGAAPRKNPPRAQQEQTQPRKGKQVAPTKPNEPCHYDARARALICVAATAMGIKGLEVWQAEKVLAQSIYFILQEGRSESAKRGAKDPLAGLPPGAVLDAKTGSIRSGEEVEEQRSERGKWMNLASSSAVAKEKAKANWGKWAATGAGFAIGGAIIGLTGGLAAPIVAPALVGLTGVSFLATTGGVIMMGTLFGLGGGGLAGYRVQKRLRGIESFEFSEIDGPARQAGVAIPSLSATICCSGLLLEGDDQAKPFEASLGRLADSRDVYAVRAEEKVMKMAGEGLKSYMFDTLLQTGGRRVGEEIIKKTALAGLSALALPLTVWGAASAALDGVFVQAKTRCHKAGLILADTLKAEVQGHRPVTLIGTSLGCTTILTALQELAKSPEQNAHLVDSVFLIGAPAVPSPSAWRRARSMASRRFVVAYSDRDMVCAIAAWLGSGLGVEAISSGQMPRVAGSKAVLGVPGVENVDVSDLVGSHFELNDGETLEKVLRRCRAMDG